VQLADLDLLVGHDRHDLLREHVERVARDLRLLDLTSPHRAGDDGIRLERFQVRGHGGVIVPLCLVFLAAVIPLVRAQLCLLSRTLSEGLRMKGFYPAGAGDLADAVETAVRQNDRNAILVPVSNFASLGGTALRDSIIWLPVSEIAQTIKELVFLRRQLIDDVYQITGLSDIMRGATDPSETAAAQELKSQYGSVRIRDRQAELVRIARDITRISAEIIAENYTPDMFAEIAQLDLPRAEAIFAEMHELRLTALTQAELSRPPAVK